jgi:hypothetical protein
MIILNARNRNGEIVNVGDVRARAGIAGNGGNMMSGGKNGNI